MLRRQARGLLVLLLLSPSMATALGLGSIETHSALNEPLEARIPLTASPEELDNLRVSLAPAEAFQRARLDRPFLLSRLNFEVVSDDGPRPYVLVTTENSLREPFLAFLVDIRWSSGRLLREYTLLLDPPVYAPRQQAPAAGRATQALPPSAAPRRVESSASTAPGRVNQPDAISETPSTAAGSPGEYGAVQRNETAWDIAVAVRPGNDISVHQMMMALVRANPEAFVDGNVNNLRAGAILRIPPRAEIQALSVAEARREFSRQVETWRAGRTPSPVQPGEGAGDQDVASDEPDGRLQVVAASQDSGTDATASLAEDELDVTAQNMRRLQRELTEMRESEAAMRAENEELRRMAQEMRQRMEILERSLNIPADPGVASPSAGAVDDAEQASPEVSTEADESPVGEQVQQVEEAESPEASETGEPTTTPVETTPAPSVDAVTAEPPAPWEDPKLQMLAAGVLLALIALLVLIVRRRRLSRADDDSVLATSATGLLTASDGSAQSAGDAVATDMAAAAPGMAEDGLFVDPLEQAEMHMEDGNLDEAVSVLNKGLSADPENAHLHLMMLEIHARNQDRGAFEADAQGLFSLVQGASDPVWQRASVLGREIAPENPLFSSGDDFDDTELDTSPLPSENDLDTALDLTAGDEMLNEPDHAAPETVSSSAAAGTKDDDLSDLDFALDDLLEEEPREEETPAAAVSAPAPSEQRESEAELQDDDLSMDFELDSLAKLGAEPPAGQAVAAADAEDDGFGLDFETPEFDSATSTVAQDPAPQLSADDLDVDFDVMSFGSEDADTEGDVATAPVSAEEGDEEELFEDADENGTKLDLARAYLDMGDAEGARSLLEEVIDEGNDEQKREAQEMLDKAK